MVLVVTFGCRINAFESEAMQEKLRDYNDLIVINTCAVTSEAERQCRQTIRKLKKEHPSATIVVTGCSAQVHSEAFEKMAEVDLVLGNREKPEIEKYVCQISDSKKHVADIMTADSLDPYMITGFEGRQKAFVQIQQGCNHRCTYCIVPYARGKNRSMPIEKVLAQVKLLIEKGLNKICLTGVDLCSYEYGLPNVARILLESIPELKELSFGSLDPAAIGDDFVALIKDFDNILPYFHFSVQSGDNLVLKQMGRRHTREDVITLCHKIRKVRPDAVFGADFICGFPTESVKAFENTCRLVKEAEIDKLHVFPYSEREGTPAARMPQIGMNERRKRAKILRELRGKIMVNFFQRLGLGLKKTSDKITIGLKDIVLKRKIDDSVLENLEELLISSDLGVSASMDIIKAFGAQKFDKEVSEQEVKEALSAEIAKFLKPLEANFDTSIHKPYIVLMVGVNGAGKTTTIGKLGAKLKAQGKQVSFIAGDTFRAAAVEQLEAWGFRSSIHVFKGEYGCDAAGLCYDGLNAAVKRGDDVVFIDTAGRLQNKNGLMDELKKIVRVIQKVIPDAPHLTLLTLDATTGQNAVSQVQTFKEIVDVNGLVITKLDGSSKGGILVAIAKEIPVPVYFVGVGEQIDDLDVFKAEDYSQSLLGI